MTLVMSLPYTIMLTTDCYCLLDVYKTGKLPAHGVFPTVDVSGFHLSGTYYHSLIQFRTLS